MLAQMPASMAAEWQAYLQEEPSGPLADDLRVGHLAAVMASIHTGKSWSADQLAPFVRLEPRQQSPEEMLRILESIGG